MGERDIEGVGHDNELEEGGEEGGEEKRWPIKAGKNGKKADEEEESHE